MNVGKIRSMLTLEILALSGASTSTIVNWTHELLSTTPNHPANYTGRAHLKKNVTADPTVVHSIEIVLQSNLERVISNF